MAKMNKEARMAVTEEGAVVNQGATNQKESSQKSTEQKASSQSPSEGVQGMSYEARFSSFNDEGSVRGVCTVTMNKAFAIRGVKVVDGSKGLFVALPSYKVGEEYKDICFPVTAEGRKSLNEAVLAAYEQQSQIHQGNMAAAAIGQTAPEGVPMQSAV